MRLLHTTTFRLGSFPNPTTPKIPPYIILSHRWGDREITFQEIETVKNTPELHNTDGYKKVSGCCQLAASVGFQWVWIDTCCIDKTNDVELTQALNSMYSWYRQSELCYAFLVDTPSQKVEDPTAKDSKFRKSRWFTRGWTLQELLAPVYVTFFSQDWEEIGTKSSLQKVITEITGIDSYTLLSNAGQDVSVAQRMAWAANRETSVEEDKAYCLMGLFGVSMPMKYGEGKKAFHRLQLEILKTSDDQSIFAWISSKNESRSLLAKSPKEFQDCNNVRRYGKESDTSAYSMTNKGLNIKLPLLEYKPNRFKAVLACQRKEYEDRYLFAIFLERVGGPNSIIFRRIKSNRIEKIKDKVDFDTRTEIYVKEDDPIRLNLADWMKPENGYTLLVRNRARGNPKIFRSEMVQWTINDSEIRLKLRNSGGSGLFIFQEESGTRWIMVLVGVHNYNVWSDIAVDYDHDDIDRIAEDYWKSTQPRAMKRWDNSDRRLVRLSDGAPVSLAIRKGLEREGAEDKMVYLIDMHIPDGFTLKSISPGEPDEVHHREEQHFPV